MSLTLADKTARYGNQNLVGSKLFVRAPYKVVFRKVYGCRKTSLAESFLIPQF